VPTGANGGKQQACMAFAVVVAERHSARLQRQTASKLSVRQQLNASLREIALTIGQEKLTIRRPQHNP
jgi:hypothetical protein